MLFKLCTHPITKLQIVLLKRFTIFNALENFWLDIDAQRLNISLNISKKNN